MCTFCFCFVPFMVRCRPFRLQPLLAAHTVPPHSPSNVLRTRQFQKRVRSTKQTCWRLCWTKHTSSPTPPPQTNTLYFPVLLSVPSSIFIAFRFFCTHKIITNHLKNIPGTWYTDIPIFLIVIVNYIITCFSLHVYGCGRCFSLKNHLLIQ